MIAPKESTNVPPPTMAVALSTKDRCDLTRRILPALDEGEHLHLFWIDGSDSDEGRALPSIAHFARSRLREIHFDVKGGPDVVIRRALRRMLDLDYELLGLVENDVELQPGWTAALDATIRHAERDGLVVGAATVRTIACRCLCVLPNYAPMWNMGAGMVLFTRAGAAAVLEDYKPTGSSEVGAFWQSRGFELHSWDLGRDVPERGLGADWWYAAAMFHKGLVSVGSVPSMARNIDFDLEAELRTSYVTSAGGSNPSHQSNWHRLFDREPSPLGSREQSQPP
jgi:hypothetical protein